MASTVKSPVREAIEAEVLAALRTSARPLTSHDFLIRCESAQDKAELARILYLMREAGTIEPGPEVAPGQPGGMTGKGARACVSYRLQVPDPAPPETVESEPSETESAQLDSAGESINGDEYARPLGEMVPTLPTFAAQIAAEMRAAASADPHRSRGFGAYVDPVIDAEADAEPEPDHAAARDPFEVYESDRWASDVLRLGELSDAALIEIADELLEGDRIWTAVRAMHRHAKQLAADWI